MTDNISELQQSYFLYENDEYNISLISGIREQDYAFDGISNEKVDYCVIMIETTEKIEIKTLTLRIDGQNFTVSPLLNPYNNNYVYDFERPLDNNSIISVSFNDHFFALENIANNLEYTYKDCLKKISKNEKISKFFINNNFNGEIFIRLIKLNDFENIFYQIVIVNSINETEQFLINPYTLEYA